MAVEAGQVADGYDFFAGHARNEELDMVILSAGRTPLAAPGPLVMTGLLLARIDRADLGAGRELEQ